MPNAQYVIKEESKHGINAVNASNIADSEIPALADAAAFEALFEARASGYWNQRQDMQFHKKSINRSIALGILTNTNVAAANTLNDIRDIFIAVNSELNRSFQSGNRSWQ